MKKFNLLVIMLLFASFIIVGCSKEKVYVLEKGNTFEVGTDIPEGTYKVESSEKEIAENDNFTTVIGEEDNPDAVFKSISDMIGKEVDLKKGEIVNSNGTIKLILTKGEK